MMRWLASQRTKFLVVRMAEVRLGKVMRWVLGAVSVSLCLLSSSCGDAAAPRRRPVSPESSSVSTYACCRDFYFHAVLSRLEAELRLSDAEVVDSEHRARLGMARSSARAWANSVRDQLTLQHSTFALTFTEFFDLPKGESLMEVRPSPKATRVYAGSWQRTGGPGELVLTVDSVDGLPAGRPFELRASETSPEIVVFGVRHTGPFQDVVLCAVSDGGQSPYGR